jgi:CHAT domain-containing protein
LLRRGIGEGTGRVRKVYELLAVLDTLPGSQANPYWRQQEERSQKDEAVTLLHAWVHRYLADFYQDTGRVLLARYHLDEAETLANTLDDWSVLPSVLESKAQFWSRVGFSDEAIREARRVLDGRSSLHERADAILLMARVFEDKRDAERAEDCCRWALDLFVKPGSFTLERSDVMAVAKIRQQLAYLRLNSGDTPGGLAALREAASFAALEYPEKAIGLHLTRLRLIEWVADANRYLPSERLQVAMRAAPESTLLAMRGSRGQTIVERGPGRFIHRDRPRRIQGRLDAEQVGLLRERFIGMVDGSDLEKARDESLDAIGKLAEQRREDVDADLAARLAEQRGDAQAASQLYHDRLEANWKAAQRSLDPVFSVESPDLMRRLHHDAARNEIRLGRPAEALRILDMVRNWALLELRAGGPSVWNRLSVPQRREAAELDDRRSEVASRVAILRSRLAQQPELADELDRLLGEQRRLEAEWQSLIARFRSRDDDRRTILRNPLTDDELEGLLSDGESLLLFSVGDFETCVVLVQKVGGRLKCRGHAISIRALELKALVDAFRLGCLQPSAVCDVLDAELYQVLLGPFAEDLADTTVLAVAPDGPLNTLPFAALRDPDDGMLLLERMAVAVVPSLTLLRGLRSAPAAARRGALIVDVQNFDDTQWIPAAYQIPSEARGVLSLLPTFHLTPLEGTRREGDVLESIFGKEAERLSDRRARENFVKSAANGKQILHFATHGVVDPYNPMQSALVLSPASTDGDEDGFLEAVEILSGGEFSGTELVTLSACETGLGLIQGSEGVLGLSWAFLAAGTRSVLASLWRVDDAATQTLMGEFYRNLREKNLGKLEALRQAQLTMLWKYNPSSKRLRGPGAIRTLGPEEPDQAKEADSPPQEQADPLYWAGFVLTGDWR